MQSQEYKSTSLFDIAEEHAEHPCPFVWIMPIPDAPYLNEDKLHSGTLQTIWPLLGVSTPCLKTFKTRNFAVTLSHLIVYKKNKPNIAKAVLKLNNPRLETADPTVQDPPNLHFKLVGYKHEYELLASTKESYETWLESLKKVVIQTDISRHYSFGKLIGKGNFAKVHIAKYKKTEVTYAIKTIEKAKMLDNLKNLTSLQKEIEILRKLNHKYIIKLYEVYENDLYVHLVIEYLIGGELFKLLQAKKHYCEKDAAMAIKCVLEALLYMHERGVIHRDLKPENLILASNDTHLKIADFGLATISQPGQLETLRCGSVGYVAPEILNNQGYNTQADIFSAGIILYILLTGVSPFHGRTYQDIILRNKEGTVMFPDKYWDKISTEGRDLVHKMVEKNPAERITAKQALQHAWLSIDHSEICLSSVIENMRKYQGKENEHRFDNSHIKPEFSMVSCTPLLLSRDNTKSPLKDSPFFFAKLAHGKKAVLNPPSSPLRVKGGLVINRLANTASTSTSAQNRHSQPKSQGPKMAIMKNHLRSVEEEQEEQKQVGRTVKTEADEDADFKEDDITEKSVQAGGSGRELPATPGYAKMATLSHLKKFGCGDPSPLTTMPDYAPSLTAAPSNGNRKGLRELRRVLNPQPKPGPEKQALISSLNKTT